MTYRFCVLLLGITIISFSLLKGPIRMTKRGWLIFFFWIIYGSLLINDISLKGIRLKGESPFYLYSFIFGSSFLSFMTLLIGGKYLKFTAKLSWGIIGFIAITLILTWQKIQIYGTTSTSLFQGRAMISSEESFGVVNPILIGSFGAFISVISLSLIIIRNRQFNLLKLGFLICTTGIGVVSVLLSGSRGPLLILVVGFILIYLKYLSFRKVTPLNSLKVIISSISLVLIFLFAFLPLINKYKITSFIRVMDFFNNNEASSNKEVRFHEWRSALQQYFNNPILGDKYVTDYDGFYPHNVYLEVLMTTGTIGGLLFFTGFLLCLNKMKKLWRINSVTTFPFILLASVIFIMRLTTGALHNSVEFWAILGYLCSASIPIQSKVYSSKFATPVF